MDAGPPDIVQPAGMGQGIVRIYIDRQTLCLLVTDIGRQIDKHCGIRMDGWMDGFELEIWCVSF
jgi:hypothetical protein